MDENTLYTVFRLLDKISHGMGVWYEDDWGSERSDILQRLLRSVQKARSVKEEQ